MRKQLLTLCILLMACGSMLRGQTTAMDFQRMDCNGNMRHLFSDLDAGNVVILEFFMDNCTPCVTAGSKLEAMKADLLAEFPGKIMGYTSGFLNSYPCSQVTNWLTSHSFTAIPMDSGASQVSYYGGFGMPTIVILGGGTNHTILGSPYIGFTTSDTTTMAADIRAYLNSATGVAEAAGGTAGMELFPNPASGQVQVRFDAKEAGNAQVEVMDMSGRRVASTSHYVANAGTSTVNLDVATLHAGCYMVRISHGEQVTHGKVVVNR